MYTIIIPYKISKKGILSVSISQFFSPILYRFLVMYISCESQLSSWATTSPHWPNSGPTAMSKEQSIRILASPTGDSGSKQVSFTRVDAKVNVGNDAYATGNIRFASRHLLPKPYAQNEAQRDVDRVAFRGQRLTNPMFSRGNEQTVFHINFGGNSVSCFRCPMTAYNACSKRTYRTYRRKERWLLELSCQIWMKQWMNCTVGW